MTDFNNFIGLAKRLEDVDIPRIGHRIGVGEDEIHAFMEVEASGSGFDALNRPKILFEPHVFYRNLPEAKRAQAVARGLAYPKQGTQPYGTSAEQYSKLIKAVAFDEDAALKGASWGATQILGENFSLVGYKTVQQMVKAFMADEENHLNAMVNYLIKTGIDDDLRNHNWDMVARVYNGPNYLKFDYANKMAKAYAKWVKIRDTAWSPNDDDVVFTPPIAPPILVTPPQTKSFWELIFGGFSSGSNTKTRKDY